jgi:hypothetical protein
MNKLFLDFYDPDTLHLHQSVIPHVFRSRGQFALVPPDGAFQLAIYRAKDSLAMRKLPLRLNVLNSVSPQNSNLLKIAVELFCSAKLDFVEISVPLPLSTERVISSNLHKGEVAFAPESSALLLCAKGREHPLVTVVAQGNHNPPDFHLWNESNDHWQSKHESCERSEIK